MLMTKNASTKSWLDIVQDQAFLTYLRLFMQRLYPFAMKPQRCGFLADFANNLVTFVIYQ